MTIASDAIVIDTEVYKVGSLNSWKASDCFDDYLSLRDILA